MKNIEHKPLITEEMILTDDHFEFEEGMPGSTPARFGSANHADIFDAATNVPVYGQFYSYGRQIGGALNDVGKVFGIGKKEDKSTTGLQKFMTTFSGLPFYPTKDEMLKAAELGKWERVEPAAIQASYDPNTGTWQRGDWHFQVVGTSPITVKDFKGANETHMLTAPLNAKGSGQAVLAPSAAPASTSASVSSPVAQSQSATPTPSPSLSPVQQQVVASLPAGSTAQDAHKAMEAAGVPAPTNTNPFAGVSGAASAGAMGGKLFGGMSQTAMIGIILGVLALVALMIFFANR